jgi:two-component sensor histidine kinase
MASENASGGANDRSRDPGKPAAGAEQSPPDAKQTPAREERTPAHAEKTPAPVEQTPDSIEHLLDTPDLAGALESERFKQFLDRVPVAIAVAELKPAERVIYANIEFERLTGQANANILEGRWDRLPGEDADPRETRALGSAVAEERDYLGSFTIPHGDETIIVDAWSNVIDDEDGTPAFRLVALVETGMRDPAAVDDLQQRLHEKDTLLRELQHRVKNNLQLITALIRAEARNVPERSTGDRFDRLAGRIEALGLLYRSLGETGPANAVDLGIYLSEIASAVMRAHAVEGIHLNLQVDTWPVSIDVAMPTGLVVNELLTNALKHAFHGRDGGTITLHSTTSPGGCIVLIADDGVGLPEGRSWPERGKLSSLIVRSLQQNAKARFDVQSAPGKGVRVTIVFDCEDAAPES